MTTNKPVPAQAPQKGELAPAGAPSLKQDFRTYIIKAQDQYLGMIENQFKSHRMNLDDYGKECVMNALYAIQGTFEKTGVTFSSPELDQTSLTGVLKAVAALRLNASATPREIYFQLRNEKKGDNWVKKIEFGIEGDGNDALLRRFGVDVKKVGTPWLVRDGDGFDFPVHTGFDVTPPVWKPTGQGQVIRVVYPIRLSDDSVEFLIQERGDVRPNLLAHIANNLMNETFGLAESRFKASAEQKKKIDVAKKKILKEAQDLALEDILDNEGLQAYISPAWTEPQSREQMIIRKMRNNAVKKYPKNFGSSLASESYNEMDESYQDAQAEIAANAGREVIDITVPKAEVPEAEETIDNEPDAELLQDAHTTTDPVPAPEPAKRTQTRPQTVKRPDPQIPMGDPEF